MKGDDKGFEQAVLEVVALIPKGRVSTYGAIGRYLGSGRSARVVGWILNRSHGKGLPAHRVVNRQGLLSGKMHFPHPEYMAEALRQEGIEVSNDQVLNFEQHFWDPGEELGF